MTTIENQEQPAGEVTSRLFVVSDRCLMLMLSKSLAGNGSRRVAGIWGTRQLDQEVVGSAANGWCLTPRGITHGSPGSKVMSPSRVLMVRRLRNTRKTSSLS